MSTKRAALSVNPVGQAVTGSYAAVHKSFAQNQNNYCFANVNGNRRSASGGGLPHSLNSSIDNYVFLETSLVRDLLFIFQGINGKFIRLNNKDGNYDINQEVPRPLRELTLKLCEVGYNYNRIKVFRDKPGAGLITQAFKHGLDGELHEYYRILADVKAKIQDATFDTPLSEELKSRERMTLIKLEIKMAEIGSRLQALACIVDACAPSEVSSGIGSRQKHGGGCCSVVFLFTEHGDPLIKSLAVSLLTTLTKPLYLILGQWILYGELEDPYNEFFIAADKDCKKEDLWHSKFHIREKMLPSFISMKQAKIILATGKNINFLRDICNNSSAYKGRAEIKKMIEETPVECLFLGNEKLLGNTILKAYRTTSDMVLKVLIEDARLIDHLNALKKYLLLGQGDFIRYLLELLQVELAKPYPKLYQHNLSAILESAIRATNAQFEDEDILRRLDTRILFGNEKETGWDVFCLDYKADGPIGTVLNEEVIVKYNQLFNTLWRIKRIEAMLSSLWKSQTTLFKHQRSMMPEIGPVLHQVQLLIQEMIHFVHQTQYYIMFEATECAWDSLMENVKKATDLDQVIKAHEGFLSTIMTRSLLDIGKRELLNQLRAIFGTVYKLSDFLTKFDEKVSIEVIKRKKLKTVVVAQRKFFEDYVAQAKGEVEQLYTVTQDLVHNFLMVLNGQQDSDCITLQCLSFRLDFNEYFAKKDGRLTFPMTYLSRRLSSTSMHHSPNVFHQSIYASMNLSHSGSNSGHSPSFTASMIQQQAIPEA